MREIKFRAWDKKTKRMFIIFDSEKQEEWYLPTCRDNYVVMQYTGLKDKNGTEIYEGDILQLINEDGRTIKAICRFGNRRLTTYNCRVIDVQCYYFEVEGRKTNPIVKNYCGKHDLEIIEIIGNIFENPELLEGE